MSTMKKNPTLVISIVAIACVGVGFFCGMKYQQTKRSSNTFARTGNMTNKTVKNGTGTGAKNGNNFGGVQLGTITAMDDTSLTVKLANGGSKIIFVSSTTAYRKTAEAAKSDLNVGDSVAVSGTTNTDGSVTATSIQLNPTTMGGATIPQNPGAGAGAPEGAGPQN